MSSENDKQQLGTQEIFLRPEAYSLSWEALDNSQRVALERIVNSLKEAIDGINPEKTAERREWFDFSAKRSRNNIYLLSGDRGTGKTSLLWSLIKLVSAPKVEAEIKEPLASKLNALKDRIVWLEPLDMEVLPGPTNLLTAILARVEKAIPPASTQVRGRTAVGILEPVPGHDSVLHDFRKLSEDISLAWSGNLSERSAHLDPDVYAREAMRIEQARLRLNQKLETVMDQLVRDIHWWGRYVSNPLFVLPVDDFDLNPSRSLELLRLIRMISVPRLFTLILGDLNITEDLFELKIAGEFAEISRTSGEHIWGRNELGLRQIARNAVRKLVPPGQRVVLGNMTVSEALAYKPIEAADKLKNILSAFKINTDIKTIKNLGDFLLFTSFLDIKEVPSKSVYRGVDLFKIPPREVADMWFSLSERVSRKADVVPTCLDVFWYWFKEAVAADDALNQEQWEILEHIFTIDEQGYTFKGESLRLHNEEAMRIDEVPERQIELPYDLQQKIIGFLSSLKTLYGSEARRALILSASLGARLESQINFDGSPEQFFRMLVPFLASYGRLATGKNALEAVLDAIRQIVGSDKQQVCDSLITSIRESSSVRVASRSRPQRGLFTRAQALCLEFKEENRSALFCISKRPDWCFDVLRSFRPIPDSKPLSGKAAGFLIVLYDLLKLMPGSRVGDDRNLNPGEQNVPLIQTVWLVSDGSELVLSWPLPPVRTFWEIDLLCSTCESMLEWIKPDEKKTEELRSALCFAWIAVGTAIVTKKFAPISIKDVLVYTTEAWEILLERVTGMVQTAEDSEAVKAINDDAEDWLCSVAVLLSPEYGVPQKVAERFQGNTVLRDFWKSRANKIKPRREKLSEQYRSSANSLLVWSEIVKPLIYPDPVAQSHNIQERLRTFLKEVQALTETTNLRTGDIRKLSNELDLMPTQDKVPKEEWVEKLDSFLSEKARIANNLSNRCRNNVVKKLLDSLLVSARPDSTVWQEVKGIFAPLIGAFRGELPSVDEKLIEILKRQEFDLPPSFSKNLGDLPSSVAGNLRQLAKKKFTAGELLNAIAKIVEEEGERKQDIWKYTFTQALEPAMIDVIKNAVRERLTNLKSEFETLKQDFPGAEKSKSPDLWREVLRPEWIAMSVEG